MKRAYSLGAILAASAAVVTAESLTVASAPPVVVRTLPAAGSLDVDPTLTEIHVVFSKDMMTDRMWSVVKLGDDSFPALTGAVRYLPDGRTFVIPVALEPGKTYAMWLNHGQQDAFRDVEGHPAVPYLLVFQTRSAGE